MLAFLLVLTKVILFKSSPHYYKNYFSHSYRNYQIREGIKKANFTPFTTIKLFYESRRLNMEYKVNNLLGNILIFMPLGFLLPLLIKKFRNVFIILLFGFLLSLFYECAQLATGIGIFDVDDIILNTLGTLTGFAIFSFLKMFFPNAQPKTAASKTVY